MKHTNTDMIQESEFPLETPDKYSNDLCDCGSGLMKTLHSRRNNTSYIHDDDNFMPPCCDRCYMEEFNYYSECWRGYYKGIL